VTVLTRYRARYWRVSACKTLAGAKVAARHQLFVNVAISLSVRENGSQTLLTAAVRPL